MVTRPVERVAFHIGELSLVAKAVMSLAGQDLEFFAFNAEDDAVGLVDAGTPTAA